MTPLTANTAWENSFQDLLDESDRETKTAARPTVQPHEVDEPTRFITAGKAYFTLRSVKTGQRYTYRVEAGDRGGWFVNLLTGPDNWSNYRYIGFIGQRDRAFRVTPKSTMKADATPVRAFAWTWVRLVAGRSIAGVEVWHEAKCGKCGKKLTVPESIRNGFGPDCLGKLQ